MKKSFVKAPSILRQTVKLPANMRRKNTNLSLGTGRHGDNLITSTQERGMHTHVIGSTGKGKTNFLEHCLRQDIKHGRGVCLIDPTGGLCEKVVAWCASTNMRAHRRIRLIEPGNREWTTSINPLRIPEDTDVSVVVENVAEAFARIWGGTPLHATPTLARVLPAVLERLASKNQTLVEAMHFFDPDDIGHHREYLLSDIDDEVIEVIWRQIAWEAKHAKADFLKDFLSTLNRLIQFIRPQALRDMFSIGADPIDFRACMDAGDVVLINLNAKNRFSEINKRILGALIVNECFMQATRRENVDRPFYLYIDECHQVLTGDMASILDGTRQFGLHAILAHQRLEQLRTIGEDMYSAVMGCTQTKIVLGGLQRADAEIMADEIAKIDIELPVQALIRPTVVGHRVRILKGGSTSESETSSNSYIDAEARSVFESSGGNAGNVLGATTTEIFDDTGNLVGTTGGESEQTTTGESWMSGESHVTSSATARMLAAAKGSTDSWSQTLEPVYKDLATAVHNVDTLRHAAAQALMYLPIGCAAVSIAKTPSVFASIPYMRDALVNDRMKAEFKDECFRRDKHTFTAGRAGEVTGTRRRILQQKVSDNLNRDDEITDFREPVALIDPDNKFD